MSTQVATLTSDAGFELAQRAGKLLAASDLVPQQFRGNLPNCVVALNMAQRLSADPLMVMQNIVIVHGRPTWSSQFLIATLNQSGRYTALRYEFVGEKGKDTYGCFAWAIERDTGDKIEGPTVTLAMAKEEGWSTKNGSKWKTMPDLMLRYRAAAFFVRTNAPEIAMGLPTADEARDVEERDMGPAEVVQSAPVSRSEDVKARLRAVTPETVDTETGEIRDHLSGGKSVKAPLTGGEFDQDDAALRQIEQAKPAGGFQPTAEEIAAIHQQEMAEAGQAAPPRQRRERGNGLLGIE